MPVFQEYDTNVVAVRDETPGKDKPGRVSRYILQVLLAGYLVMGGGAAGWEDILWEPPQCIFRQASMARAAVALTFDDGPSPRYTPQIQQLLDDHGAKATFFVMGRHAQRYPNLVRRLAVAGHEIGNHTYTHPHPPQIDVETLTEEIEATRLVLQRLGVPFSGLFRPPYSQLTSDEEEYIQESHRRLILWNIDSGDWRGLSAGQIVQRVASQLQPGAIIVFHDSNEHEAADRQPTVEALRVLLPLIEARGLDCVTVSELLGPASPSPTLTRGQPGLADSSG